MEGVQQKYGAHLPSFHDLYAWSISNPELFWHEMWHFAGIQAEHPYTKVLSGTKMPDCSWFEGATLNFAKNLLRHKDDKVALIFRGEDRIRRSVSYRELIREVSRVAQALREIGVAPGDRVVGYMPNMPESIIAMLAATSCGATWASCSPDFGVQGVLDRFGQISPTVLFAAPNYLYKGASIDVSRKLTEIVKNLPSVRRTILVPYTGEPPIALPPNSIWMADLPPGPPEPTYESLPARHPIYLMFSSGTTGIPKCIIHTAAGVLIEHLKEHLLHVNLHPGEVFFYQTTCGWMMWNWLVSGLATGATLLLYDGFPLLNGGRHIFNIIEEEKVSVFGTSAKFLGLIEKDGLIPGTMHRYASLRTILSTGSVLPSSSFDYVYQSIKPDVQLSSISGGTDIVGCFALGAPTLPVLRGELQTRSLGLKVEVFDPNDNSITGAHGELVCTAPFPSMPLGLWNDADGSKFKATYFHGKPGVWHHGDYVEITPQNGMIFYGRSDAVLNPGGVRIGTAEIYRIVENFPEIIESIAVGKVDGADEQIVLFVRMQEGTELTDSLKEKLSTALRAKASPFHVPKTIVAAPDLPRTHNGKLAELVVKAAINGLPVKNSTALANPEIIEWFRAWAQA